MRFSSGMLVIILMILSVFPIPVFSQNICEGSNDAISAALVKERNRYEEKRKDMERQLLSRSEAFQKCSSQKWRMFWSSRLAEAEAKREKLEHKRNEIKELRKSIESNPGPSRVARYCERMEDVFHAYDLYISGIQSYLDFIDASVDLCKNQDFTEPALEIAAKYVNEIVTVIRNLSEIFKKP